MPNLNVDDHVFRSPTLVDVVEESINFFETTPLLKLPPKERFAGTGVYALYKKGPITGYPKIIDSNYDNFPIYVGKAVPRGWRQARIADELSPALFTRLREHAKSISSATNLNLDIFNCRFMVLSGVESSLISAVEARLIQKYKPLWNTVIDGFGNHDPGSGRYEQAVSEWDILHPGRNWVTRLKGQSSNLDEIMAKINKYYEHISTNDEQA